MQGNYRPCLPPERMEELFPEIRDGRGWSLVVASHWLDPTGSQRQRHLLLVGLTGSR